MKHGRSDYDERIQDAAGLIPEDEPVFLIRAQDVNGARAVMMYSMLAQTLGIMCEMLGLKAYANMCYHTAKSAMNQAQAMNHWQRKMRGQLPDLPDSPPMPTPPNSPENS